MGMASKSSKTLFSLLIIHLFALSQCKSPFKISRMSHVARSTKFRGDIQKVNDDMCYDVDKERCSNYDMYCATRTEFMSENCKLTCQMCKPGDPLMDLSSKCASELKKNGRDLCSKVEWSSVCPHSCDDHICADKAPEICKTWISTGGCITKHTYMTENCRLSCGMCTPGDPLMDTTSECKSKESQCNDAEWQEICPHTCRGYATGSSLLQPQQPVGVVQSQLPPPANSGQQQPAGVGQPVQPQATVTRVPLQQQQQPGVAQNVGPPQPPAVGQPVQAQQPTVNVMPAQAQQQAAVAIPTQAHQPGAVAMPVQAQQPGVVAQPVPLQQAGQVPQTFQPQQPAVVNQPAQAQQSGVVASPVQAQQLGAVNQPSLQPLPSPQNVLPTQPQSPVALNSAGQVLQTQQLPMPPQVNQPTQFQPTTVQGQPQMPQAPIQSQTSYQPVIYNPGNQPGAVVPMKKQKGEKASNGKTSESKKKMGEAKTKNEMPDTTKKKETKNLGFRKMKEPGEGIKINATDKQAPKHFNHERDEKTTQENGAKKLEFGKMKRLGGGIKTNATDKQSPRKQFNHERHEKTTQENETKKLEFRKMKEPGEGSKTNATDKQSPKQFNHERHEKTTQENETKKLEFRKIKEPGEGIKEKATDKQAPNHERDQNETTLNEDTRSHVLEKECRICQ